MDKIQLNENLIFSQLNEHVTQMAEKLDWLRTLAQSDPRQFRHASNSKPEPSPGRNAVQMDLPDSRNPLPDPKIVRKIIRQRQKRSRHFESGLFADPAWDMLLDLTAARAEHKRISVTSLCIASGVSSTTALRWIGLLISSGLIERVDDDADRRRVFVNLTDKGVEAMTAYFADLGNEAGRLV